MRERLVMAIHLIGGIHIYFIEQNVCTSKHLSLPLNLELKQGGMVPGTSALSVLFLPC